MSRGRITSVGEKGKVVPLTVSIQNRTDGGAPSFVSLDENHTPHWYALSLKHRGQRGSGLAWGHYLSLKYGRPIFSHHEGNVYQESKAWDGKYQVMLRLLGKRNKK